MPIVYKITNKTNGKSYVGWTSHTLEERWGQHVKSAMKEQSNRKFYNAIRKYGVEVWNTEILCEVADATEAKNKEIELIQHFDSYYQGYNATLGGDGNNGIIMSEESNKARSDKLKGIPKNYNRMLGKKHSETSKQKIADAHKGMKKPWVQWTKEQCIARGMKRRSLTEEQYKLIHQLRVTGLKINEISISTGLSTDLVKKWLKMEW